jgi:hypothetical protein
MFTSNASRLHMYYAATHHAEKHDCNVAMWMLHSIESGLCLDKKLLAPGETTRWPIVSIMEITCPFAGSRCPRGWHFELAWFQKTGVFVFGCASSVRAIVERNAKRARF